MHYLKENSGKFTKLKFKLNQIGTNKNKMNYFWKKNRIKKKSLTKPFTTVERLYIKHTCDEVKGQCTEQLLWTVIFQ